MKKQNLLDRLRAKKARREGMVVGVCWYDPENWARVKADASDSETFENTFSEWETMANESLASIRTAYPNATQVFVSADELFAWCRAERKINDASTRSEFVGKLLRERAS